MMQNNITGLAIISGYILRDMYFSEQFSLSVCQQRKNELETWMANLSNPLRQHLGSGVILNLPKDQTEAAVSLRSEKRIQTDTALVQFTFHATRSMDVTYKALTLEGGKNEDVND